MIVIMQVGATKAQVSAVVANVKSMGLSAHIIEGQERTVVAVVGDDRSAIDRDVLSAMEGVERMMPVLAPYKIASREVHPANTLIALNGIQVGDRNVIVIAGPRAIDPREPVVKFAQALKKAGASALCINVYGPTHSPYDAQGPGETGLEALAEVRDRTGLPIVSEVMEPEAVTHVARYADVLQIGGQSMQNFPLLNAVGESQRPVLLKRGIVNTLEELLMAAEYILSHGNRQIMLCEGGIRTYESYTRNMTFDINAVPVLKGRTHLPVVVDVSQAAGHWEFVAAAAKAAVAAGADGLIVEVECPRRKTVSKTDDETGLHLDKFAALVKDLRRVAEAVGRSL
jgi:3-deoxy-7-phosphoheptulonate synthase